MFPATISVSQQEKNMMVSNLTCHIHQRKIRFKRIWSCCFHLFPSVNPNLSPKRLRKVSKTKHCHHITLNLHCPQKCVLKKLFSFDCHPRLSSKIAPLSAQLKTVIKVCLERLPNFDCRHKLPNLTCHQKWSTYMVIKDCPTSCPTKSNHPPVSGKSAQFSLSSTALPTIVYTASRSCPHCDLFAGGQTATLS